MGRVPSMRYSSGCLAASKQAASRTQIDSRVVDLPLGEILREPEHPHEFMPAQPGVKSPRQFRGTWRDRFRAEANTSTPATWSGGRSWSRKCCEPRHGYGPKPADNASWPGTAPAAGSIGSPLSEPDAPGSTSPHHVALVAPCGGARQQPDRKAQEISMPTGQ